MTTSPARCSSTCAGSLGKARRASFPVHGHAPGYRLGRPSAGRARRTFPFLGGVPAVPEGGGVSSQGADEPSEVRRRSGLTPPTPNSFAMRPTFCLSLAASRPLGLLHVSGRLLSRPRSKQGAFGACDDLDQRDCSVRVARDPASRIDAETRCLRTRTPSRACSDTSDHLWVPSEVIPWSW